MTRQSDQTAKRKVNTQVKIFLGTLFLSISLLLVSANLLGATYIAYNTGNWSSRSTWVTTKTGSVTVVLGSTSVVGVGTTFTTQLQVGDKIYKDASTGLTVVGTVSSITDNTHLTLTSGASIALVANTLYSHGLPTSTDDIQIGYLNGTLITTLTVDGNYTCNLMTFVQNGGVAYTVDIPTSKSLTVTAYAYLTSTNSNGNVSTLNVSGTFTTGGLFMQGANSATQNRVSQLTIQTSGVSNILGDIYINGTNAPAKVIISAVGTGTLNLKGNFLSTTSNLSSTTPYCAAPVLTPSTTIRAGLNNFSSTSVINFNGTNTLQVLPLSNTTVYGNVYFNNTGNNVATFDGNITAANVLGDVKIQSGIFTNQGASSSTTLNAASTNYTITGNAGKTFEVDNGATLKEAGTSSFPTGFGTIVLQPTSTVDYMGTTQTIPAQNFGNLTISAGASAGRAVTLSSSGTIGVYSNYSPSTTNNVYTLIGSTVSFNGTSAQTIGATYATNFNNLIIASGSTVTLNSNTNIAGNLTVSIGTFDLGSFTANRTSAGGTLTVANNATLKIGGTNSFPTNYSTVTLVVAGTVEYSGTNQTIANQLYGNLTLSSSSGAAIKTFPGTALTINGNLTSTLGSGSSVSFTAASDITVNGNTSIGASTTFNGSSYTYYIGGNWANNGTYNGNTGTLNFFGTGITVSGTGAQNFNNVTIAASLVSFSSFITLAGNLATTGSGSFNQASGGTLLMTGSGKTISGSSIVLDNLTVSGTVSTSSLEITGNLSVSGSFTSPGTITMSGASKTISGTAISFSVLFITGSVTTASSFSISSGLAVNGSFTASAGTVTFTGSSALSGTANLFNTTINGTSLQLSANSTLGISNTLTISSGTLNATSTMPNTVNFNGTGAQNINAIGYSNLTLSNGSTKTAVGSITTSYNLTIGASTTFEPSSYTHSIYGNWINNGTFNAGISSIQFVGSSTSYITGATTFNTLTSNRASSTAELILNSNVTAALVNMISGEIATGSNTLTITNTRTGNGNIEGNIQRTHAFTTGLAYTFKNPNNTITFSSVSAVSSIKVSVTDVGIDDFTFGSSMNEEYTIDVPAGTYNATLRLSYDDDELNGNDESAMGLWNYSGSAWVAIGKTDNSTSNNYVEMSGLTNITNRWTCAVGSAKVVQWNGSVSTDWHTANNWTIIQGGASRPPSSSDIVELGTVAFTYQPTISNNESVKSIDFGSAQSVTVTLASGGSLTTVGDIEGNWSANVIHTLNVNNQTLTVNGDLNLSDGVNGQAIDLNIGSGAVNVMSSLTESGNANINFSSNGTLSIHKDFDYASGTFTAGSGTVVYNGDQNQQVAAVTYNNLTVNKSAGIATIDETVSVMGSLLISSGRLNNGAATEIMGNVTIDAGSTLFNSDMIHIGGNWTNNGTYTGIGSHIKFNGNGTQTISASTFTNLVINKPVGSSAILTGNIVINGDLTVTSGTFNIKTFDCNRSIQGGTLTLADDAIFIVGANNAPLNFSQGSLSALSTVIADGTVPQSIYGADFGNLIFRNSGLKTLVSPITVNGTLTIESGATFDGGAETITLNGNWVNNGTFTPSTGTVLCSGVAKTITGNTTFNKLTVTGSYTILSNTVHNGLLDITNTGSLSGGATLVTTLNGDLINRGTLYALGTTTYSGNTLQTLSLINAVSTVAITVNFNGSVSPVLNSTSAPQFGYLNINNTGGINPSVGWTVLYGLTVGTGASFNGGSSTHNFLGSVTNNGTITSNGTLNFIPATAKTINLGSNFSSTGTVVFGGAGALTLAGPASVFHDIVVSNTNAAGINPVSDWTITNSLTINIDAILNAGSHLLLLGGNWINNGSFNASTGTVEFNGSSAQKISGLAVSNFNNIIVSNLANPGVSVQSKQNLLGVLTLRSNVVFDADGTSNSAEFTLISSGDDPAIDASIGPLPTGARVDGKVTVQRYMSKEGRNFTLYRYISSPVQNAPVADLQHELPVIGKFTGRSACCGSTPNLFYYKESLITKKSLTARYIAFPTSSNEETFATGRGYSLKVYGGVVTSTLWDLRGEINAGNFTPVALPVTYTSTGKLADDGWNLVGNPFPSAIDWNSSGWTKTNIENTIYIPDNSSGTLRFATWNGVIGVNGGSQYIATGQGFWVKANGVGAPVLTANENIKSSGTRTSFFRVAAPENLLRITLVKGKIKDETVIHFREKATNGFDASMDSRKMMNSTINISSALSDGLLMAINSLPSINCESVVKLSIDKLKAGAYQLAFTDVNSFTNGAKASLKDKYTGSSIAVSEGTIYNFAVTTQPASYGANRFEIQFSTEPIHDFKAKGQQVCEQTAGVIAIGKSQAFVVYQALLNAMPVSNTVMGTGDSIKLYIDKKYLKTGINNLTVLASSAACTTLSSETEVSLVVIEKPKITTLSASSCEPASLELKVQGTGMLTYNWYDSETDVIPLQSQTTPSFLTPFLSQSRAYYVSAINEAGCEGSREPVQALINQLEEVFIVADGSTLRSSSETDNQWFLNNIQIPGAKQPVITPEESGVYKLTVTKGACSVSTEHLFVVDRSTDNDLQVMVFPNPVVSMISIEIQNLTEYINGTIINAQGETVETFELDGTDGIKSKQLDMSNYQPGLYFVRIKVPNKLYDVKIIKN